MSRCDVCIIGSGAGAAPVAYTLARAGYRVVILERGAWRTERDFTKDEIAATRRPIYTPPLHDDPQIVEYYDGAGQVRRAEGMSFRNGTMVGGASNLMSGYFHRLKPVDFALRSTFGPIEGANVVDWPITYDDLAPWYRRVEQIVGVSGRVTPHPHAEPRERGDFPFPPTWEQPISAQIDAACRALGYHSFPTPRAILPHDALGRNGCSYSNYCGSYGCATGAKGSARAALLDPAVRSGRCEIRTHAFAYRIEADAQRAKAVHYYDRARRSHRIEAGVIVVAASPIESVRLLMNSTWPHHPDGIGNVRQRGKNLIFSGGGSGQGQFELDRMTPQQRQGMLTFGAFVNRSLQDWYVYTHAGKARKGGTIDFLFEHANPIARASRELYDATGQIRRGRALQQHLARIFTQTRTLKFEVFNDWLPTDRGFVRRAPITDPWGVPVAAVRVFGHPRDVEVGQFLADKAVRVLETMGAVNIRTMISDAPPTNLIAGGCRFGRDPATSVLDPTCRVHGLTNLYVTDASFMPTGGSVPYTWTIYANAFRVAEVIRKQLAGAIPSRTP